MTRDEFPYSLQPYATPEGGDLNADVEEWSLVLFRAADEAERAWFREHGFVMQGRVWLRTAPKGAKAAPKAAPMAQADAQAQGSAPDAASDEDPETGPGKGPTPDVAA